MSQSGSESRSQPSRGLAEYLREESVLQKSDRVCVNLTREDVRAILSFLSETGTKPSISPALRAVLREYDAITAKADRGNPEWDFVMRAADYRLIRESLAKLPVEIINPPKGWTP